MLSQILLGALLAAPCSALEPLPQVSLREPFEVELGQAVAIEGEDLILRFDAVTADSRCPVDVTCVWAGNASVRVVVETPDDPELELILNTHGGERFPNEACVGDRRLGLIRLAPQRTSTDSDHEPLPYIATLRLEPSCPAK